jgi:rhodanese-related sulfurtransferase
VLKRLLLDCWKAMLLVALSLMAGLVLNAFRAHPLPLFYVSADNRLKQEIQTLVRVSPIRANPGQDVRLVDVEQAIQNHNALIIDARPAIFYNLEHIPSSISLPRDQFQAAYAALAPLLSRAYDKPIIVYCSGRECQDSQMVADALCQLRYSHVHIFRGGWKEWDAARLQHQGSNE